jgi:ATP-dependent DNA ligase
VRPDGTSSFSLIQNASDTGNGDALVFCLFDLLHLDGEPVSVRPLKERKERLPDSSAKSAARLICSGRGV